MGISPVRTKNDSYLMTHTPSYRFMNVIFEKKICYNLYFDQLTHQFENSHKYQNVKNEFFFHFRWKSSNQAHVRQRKIKKPKIRPSTLKLLTQNNRPFVSSFGNFDICSDCSYSQNRGPWIPDNQFLGHVLLWHWNFLS